MCKLLEKADLSKPGFYWTTLSISSHLTKSSWPPHLVTRRSPPKTTRLIYSVPSIQLQSNHTHGRQDSEMNDQSARKVASCQWIYHIAHRLLKRRAWNTTSSILNSLGLQLSVERAFAQAVEKLSNGAKHIDRIEQSCL